MHRTSRVLMTSEALIASKGDKGSTRENTPSSSKRERTTISQWKSKTTEAVANRGVETKTRKKKKTPPAEIHSRKSIRGNPRNRGKLKKRKKKHGDARRRKDVYSES